jgi:adenine-specific DNA-methyltransferase
VARRTSPKKSKSVEDYRHEEATRPNNPPAGLAQYDSERPPKRRFDYDPHLDPQLVWAGKAEHQSFEVEAPSIHVHERLSTEAILRAVRKEPPQLALFGDEELERSKAIEFYQHEQGWVNRLVLGDSLVVMASLLEKERLAGRVQMIYVDPPYGIDFNSNFQARISDRAPKETSAEALTREPEQIQAFRDTWQLGIHSYLTYLQDRLIVARELLADTGSLFVQIGPDRMHVVRAVLDELFGAANCVATITVQKTAGQRSRLLPEVADFVLWYAKDKAQVRYHQLYEDRRDAMAGQGAYRSVELADGSRRPMTRGEREDPSTLPGGARVFRPDNITSPGFSPHKTVDFEFEGRSFHPGANNHWKLRVEGMAGLARARRLVVVGDTLSYVRYADEGGLVRRTNVWTDTGQAGFAQRKKRYVVETNPKIVERCLLMCTDPGDLVLDPTCGSGTTAYVAEKHGRRWVTADTSRVAVTLARERLLTATFPYYRLRDEERGVDAGLRYTTRPWVTASSIGYSEDSEVDELAFEDIVLYDQPETDASRIRVSGPFSVEALSRYAVNPLQDDVPPEPDDAQAAETQNHVATLLDALRKQGIPRKEAKPTPIDSLQPVANAGWIQAEGTYTDSDGSTKTLAVSLGPRFGPITVAQIDDTLHDAYGWDLVVFAGFAANAEAQQLVTKGQLGKFKVALLEANPDLLVGDLLKTTSSSQTFRLFSAPEVHVRLDDSGDVRIEVVGVDSFDASTGEVVSRGQGEIAAWFLDQDYDGIVFHVNQAFFPRSSGWEALQRALKGTVHPELMEVLESFESLPFKSGEHRRAAVRVVDDFGTTSEATLSLD